MSGLSQCVAILGAVTRSYIKKQGVFYSIGRAVGTVRGYDIGGQGSKKGGARIDSRLSIYEVRRPSGLWALVIWDDLFTIRFRSPIPRHGVLWACVLLCLLDWRGEAGAGGGSLVSRV